MKPRKTNSEPDKSELPFQGCKLQPQGQILPAASFYTIHEPWSVFTLLNNWKKNSKTRITVSAMWKLSEVQLSVSINKVLLEHQSLIFLDVVSDSFMSPKLSWRVTTKNILPIKPKIFISGSLQKSLFYLWKNWNRIWAPRACQGEKAPIRFNLQNF